MYVFIGVDDDDIGIAAHGDGPFLREHAKYFAGLVQATSTYLFREIFPLLTPSLKGVPYDFRWQDDHSVF